MTETTSESGTASTKIERPDSNERRAITIVPIFPPDSPEAALQRSPSGSLGVYKVTFILARPGILDFHSELDFSKLMASGDSLLEVPEGIAQIKLALSDKEKLAEITFGVNEAHRLALAEAHVHASNFADAEKKAYSIVLPTLSWWSFRFDVALDINGYEVLEIATRVRKWVFGIEGRFKSLMPDNADQQIKSSPELRPVFAAYREGLSATNLFYQCLSFYKVTEAIKELRKKRRNEAKASDKPIEESSERIPNSESSLPISDPLTRQSFQPYLGKKYSWVLDHFRELIRNALAHLNPLQEVLVPDYYDDVARCQQAVPVLKFIAREMIRNELLARFGVAPVD